MYTHSLVATQTRTLSTAEERREEILVAAEPLVAARGLHATPTLEVARAAGISQAYLFRLFPTKVELGVALVERCNDRIHRAFADAAVEARRDGTDVLEAMGRAYKPLVRDRTMLLLQLHAHAASPHVPEIREAMRTGFGRLVDFVSAETGAEPLEVKRFFAHGMLINVLLAMGAYDLDEPWARALTAEYGAC